MFGLAFFWLVQAAPAAAQNPPRDGVAELPFVTTELEDSSEGYLTLEWPAYGSASVDGEAAEAQGGEAVTYRVRDEDGLVYYRGAVPKAFISGLPDGRHAFMLSVLDSEGQVVATSPQPAVVTVEHWSLWLAGTMFAIGFVVVSCLIGVIVWGRWLPAAKSQRLAAEGATA